MRALWRALPPTGRRWVLLNALLVTAVINTVLNAGIAWLGIRGMDEVPLWDTRETSLVTDTVGTLFLLLLRNPTGLVNQALASIGI